MKIIVSDTDAGHGSTMQSIIASWCPDAIIDIRVESFSESVAYARSNGYHLISRSTTGLNDSRIDTEGSASLAGNVYSVHSHQSNTNELISNPSKIGSIVCVRATGTSYGPGAEFTLTESNQSNATSTIAGMLAKIVHETSKSFDDARQALRESSTNWNLGWNINDGFNNPDFSTAYSASTNEYNLNTIRNISFNNSYNQVTINWEASPSGSKYLVRYVNPITINSSVSGGLVLYYGENTSYTYTHSLSQIAYFGLFVSGSNISRLETFTTGSILLLSLIKSYNNGNGGVIKFKSNSVSNDKIIIR